MEVAPGSPASFPCAGASRLGNAGRSPLGSSPSRKPQRMLDRVGSKAYTAVVCSTSMGQRTTAHPAENKPVAGKATDRARKHTLSCSRPGKRDTSGFDRDGCPALGGQSPRKCSSFPEPRATVEPPGRGPEQHPPSKRLEPPKSPRLSCYVHGWFIAPIQWQGRQKLDAMYHPAPRPWPKQHAKSETAFQQSSASSLLFLF